MLAERTPDQTEQQNLGASLVKIARDLLSAHSDKIQAPVKDLRVLELGKKPIYRVLVKVKEYLPDEESPIDAIDWNQNPVEVYRDKIIDGVLNISVFRVEDDTITEDIFRESEDGGIVRAKDTKKITPVAANRLLTALEALMPENEQTSKN